MCVEGDLIPRVPDGGCSLTKNNRKEMPHTRQPPHCARQKSTMMDFIPVHLVYSR